ncbi:hypothetical protein TrVE_jg11861 [Triparma verrucosa]|nr:hypothetical protein TrVE_jg11861 [Triparma verrucosa]
MAEDQRRLESYSYAATSNLVLSSNKGKAAVTEKGKGEVQSLWGKTGTQRMGDAVRTAAPASNKRQKRSNSITEPNAAQQDAATSPALLKCLRDLLGHDLPFQTLMDAHNEVLELTLDSEADPRSLKSSVEEFLDKKLSNDVWDPLRSACNSMRGKYTLLRDRNVAVDEEGGEMNDEGVAVVFEDEQDEENEEGQDFGETILASDSESEDEEEGNVVSSETVEGEAANNLKKPALKAASVDEFYVQRLLKGQYPDDDTARTISKSVLECMSDQGMESREVQNKMVVIMGFDKFELVQQLLRDRWTIVYGVMLSAATDRDKVEQEIAMTEEGRDFLDSLKEKDDVRGLERKNVDKRLEEGKLEAQKLKSLAGGAADTAATKHKSDKDNLDLDRLAFKDGARTMTNEDVNLPSTSWRVQKAGYEEVHVPAVRNVPGEGERFVEISELPEWTHAAFAGMNKLNRLQSKMLPAAFEKSENLLLCAPTGAGKTNVACLTMLNIMGQYMHNGVVDAKAFKIVYVAPMKALVQEVVKNFGRRLKAYDLSVRELSGDSTLTRQQIMDTNVIVTTPEKWDIITRKSDDRSYTQMVKLIIIDEIHLLHDSRGPVLESIVGRTIRQVEQSQEPVRIVGLSATLPNYADVATFLRVKPETGLFFFDNSFRPVPLQQQYIGVSEKNSLKKLKLVNDICYEKVLQQREANNQILIFCHSRAECAKTAKALRDIAQERDQMELFVKPDSASREILEEEKETVKNPALQDVVGYGFGIHHAGLAKSDRELVEDLFADKHMQVLVCTATLAWGVNLPAHSVIIKGTQMYNPEVGGWVELSPLDIMQMLGRAGRPQFDSEGEGIIITNHEDLQYYLSLMNLQLPVESQLIKVLPNHLNAEVVLGSIQSIDEAVDWLAYTYLYVRMLRSPAVYGADLTDDPDLKDYRRALVHSAACMLEKSQLIRYDRKSGSLQSTPMGKVSSHFYIDHESMKTYNQHLKPAMNDIELLRLFSLSGEFKQLIVRADEKLELQKLATKVPIPVKESVEEKTAKVNILLQAYISKLKLEGFALLADMVHVQQSAGRIMRCLFEIAMNRGWCSLAKQCLSFAKSVQMKIWQSQTPLRQFKNVPEIVAKKLERKDIPWERYVDLKPADLGELVGAPKMGRTLHTLVSQFPRLELQATVQPITRSMLKIELTLTPDFTWDEKVHDYAQLFHIMVEDCNQTELLHQQTFMLRVDTADIQHFVTFSVPVMDPLPPNYFIRVVSDRWMHSESIIPVSFKNLILPGKLLPPTALLDLSPLPVTALGNKGIMSLYNFKAFNAIQTQTFHALFETDANALVCAPTGSGKTVLAEFALLRALSKDGKAKMIYVVAKKEVAAHVERDWKSRFGKIGVTTAALTGDIAEDKKIMKSEVNIIVCYTEYFDAVSRLKPTQKVLASLVLACFDEVHLLGGEGGPILEICVSRMRRVIMDAEADCRFLGLSASLANAKDVGDWMGVKSSNLFNFSPKVRPIALDTYVQSFEVNNFSSRLLAMGKPLYNGIRRHSTGKPALVFVPSRRQAQLTAIDLMTYASNGIDENFDGFLREGSEKALEAILGSIKESALGQVLEAGVGFVHKGMDASDRKRVEGLFRDGVISVLVATHDMCWALDVPAHFVAVVGTESFDGKEQRYVDHSIADMLRMIGKAGRAGIDSSAKALVLCHAPKRAHLKKLLFDPLPIESHLDGYLHDAFMSEVCTKVVENQQEALDYLTWSFMYRRLNKNPIYYGLQGVSQQDLGEHLSDIVETVLGDLNESKCVELDEETGDVSALNLGYIGSNYYLAYSTIELIAASVTEKTRTRGIVEIVSAASEFASLPMRSGEERQLKIACKNLPYINKSAQWNDPNNKALVLLQAYFDRKALNVDLKQDQNVVVEGAVKLLQAVVDVVATNHWLKPAIEAMEVSQMVTQGVWKKDDALKQIPWFTDEIIKKARAKGVTSPFDILELEDDVRGEILSDYGDESTEMAEIAAFCNSFPTIEVGLSVVDADEITAGDPFRVSVKLQREVDEDDMEEDEVLGKVVSKRFPSEDKMESWWLVLGDEEKNKLYTVKRTSLAEAATLNLDSYAPEEVGEHELKLFLICDSYMGVDQEFVVKINVQEGGDSDEEEDSD